MHCPTCSPHKRSKKALDEHLKAKYGARPKHYADFLHTRHNEAQARFTETLPAVFEHARKIARKHRLHLTKEEIATNILSEGAVIPLTDGRYEKLSGFGAFGIDTIADRQAELAPYLDDETKQLLKEPTHVWEHNNEKGEIVHSLSDITMEQGMYANASMYVWSKARVATDLQRMGKSIDDLPPEGQFFWSTVYFNAGPEKGKAHLRDWGVDAWKEPWTKDDSDVYGNDSRYNAHWRTATFESLSGGFDSAPRDPSKNPWE